VPIRTCDVTVITPAHPARVRNGLLRRAVDSVWRQSWTPAGISLAIDTRGEGAPATRQRALNGVVGTKWVAPLDSDDYFLPPHLESLVTHAEETGADLVYSWFKVETNTGVILEEDPIFPPGHYLNPFDPADPIETTVTVLVRTELAQEVGYRALDRGQVNTGEDRFFLMGCLAAGAKIEHLVRKTWIWSHHGMNTSGLPTKGDAR
jgi:glycosyltransferase involved in cell wall biosynthesis